MQVLVLFEQSLLEAIEKFIDEPSFEGVATTTVILAPGPRGWGGSELMWLRSFPALSRASRAESG